MHWSKYHLWNIYSTVINSNIFLPPQCNEFPLHLMWFRYFDDLICIHIFLVKPIHVVSRKTNGNCRQSIEKQLLICAEECEKCSVVAVTNSRQQWRFQLWINRWYAVTSALFSQLIKIGGFIKPTGLIESEMSILICYRWHSLILVQLYNLFWYIWPVKKHFHVI